LRISAFQEPETPLHFQPLTALLHFEPFKILNTSKTHHIKPNHYKFFLFSFLFLMNKLHFTSQTIRFVFNLFLLFQVQNNRPTHLTTTLYNENTHILVTTTNSADFRNQQLSSKKLDSNRATLHLQRNIKHKYFWHVSINEIKPTRNTEFLPYLGG
jgi:hypothetical protein